MAVVTEADLADPVQAQAVVDLLDDYAQDPTGGGIGLGDRVRRDLIPALQRRHDALVLLAMEDGQAAGILSAFETFSTFVAAPLLNVRDVYVAPAQRGRGIGRALLGYAEGVASGRGYCQITLEVLSGNMPALRLCHAQGFEAFALDERMGHALFWQKRFWE
jgi:GNAT superfamily N-acetyltransferase